VVSEVGPPEPVADLFPMLRFILGPEVERLSVVPSREIARELYTSEGSVREPKDLEVRDGIVYRSTELSDGEFVRRLAERFGETLDTDEVRQILQNAHDAGVEAMLKRVREKSSDAEKLLELVGADAIRSRIPRELIEAVEETDGDLDPIATAGLALNVFGVEVIKNFKDVLVERGLQPPGTWTGGRAAVNFVTVDLGLARKYAGFAEVKTEKELTVPGPSPLPPLHPFQRRSADAIRELTAGGGGKRGMLSLPTGAGKTRVAVQALTEEIAKGNLTSPVLWIAQTEELCEQAVQSWAEVWRSAGPRETLRVSRRWGTSSAGPREDEGPQVVVATINKLVDRCVDNPEYEWLRDGVTCVVVDEAHTSISAMHVTLLRWLSMDLGKERVPLIGLSATPFRGTSEVETERLVNRYGRRRLDKDAFEEAASITLLQREGILAMVDHRVLEGSDDVPLTAAEKDEISRLKRLPASVLNKIGGDLDRTNRLVDSVMELDADWPVLLFAASVPHARTVAALLERRGRSAAAISADTPVPVRRHLVQEFRAGRLDTLTNFGVLTQGFDAPSVRALYIARPTYSPNLYQQMIGRGLRGPKNGGKERCLVVDVADNVVVHGAELAFREFEYLWTA
jgi:superfamily II DNA or RNA helicase